jgi:hypothetical protein
VTFDFDITQPRFIRPLKKRNRRVEFEIELVRITVRIVRTPAGTVLVHDVKVALDPPFVSSDRSQRKFNSVSSSGELPFTKGLTIASKLKPSLGMVVGTPSAMTVSKTLFLAAFRTTVFP